MVRWPILDGTKAQRQARRQQAGTLCSLHLRPSTLKRYNIAVFFFFQLLSGSNEQLPSSAVATGEVLGEFIEDAWAQGEPRSRAGYVLSGIQHFVPSLRKALNNAWRLFGTWARNEVPSRARPLLPQQALAMQAMPWSPWLLAQYTSRKGQKHELLLLKKLVASPFEPKWLQMTMMMIMK